MRNISVLCRILLPPVFLFRFCLPRPPETSSGHGTMIGDVELLDGNSDAQNHISQTHVTVFTNNRNRDAGISRMEPAGLGKISKHTWLAKGKPNYRRERQRAFSALVNFPRIVTNLFPIDDVDNFNTKKVMIPFRTDSDILSVSQSAQVHRRKHKFSAQPLQLPFKQNVSIEAKNKENNKADLRQGESLHVTKFPSSHNSPKRYRSHGTARHRSRRSIQKTLSSTRFKHQSVRTALPEYMVHLFQLLSGTHYEKLRNFVVTGFVNVNENNDSTETSQSTGSRTYRLIFDVQIPHETESIHYAELRLFVIRRHHQSWVHYDKTSSDTQEPSYKISIIETNRHVDLKHRLIALKTVMKSHRTWLSFNVTSAVLNWSYSGLRTLDVTFGICVNCTDADGKNNESSFEFAGNGADDMILNLDNNLGHGPLLVIFSKKYETQSSVPRKRDIRDTTKIKEETNKLLNKNVEFRSNDNTYKNNTILPSAQYFEGLIDFITTVSGDSSNDLKSNELDFTKNVFSYTNTVYQQNSKEAEQIINNTYSSTFLTVKNNLQSTPDNSRILKPSEGRNIGTNEASRNIHRRDQKHFTFLSEFPTKTKSSDTESAKLSDDDFRMRVRRQTKARYRRHLDSLLKHEMSEAGTRRKRSKKKRTSCQRKEMYVDFETIKWDKIIIFPRGYQAFECTGKCYTPISEYLTPTKHAIIQTLVHTSYPEQASRACCVPTKLDPISILYMDDYGDIKYDYTYEGMVVAECGCR